MEFDLFMPGDQAIPPEYIETGFAVLTPDLLLIMKIIHISGWSGSGKTTSFLI